MGGDQCSRSVQWTKEKVGPIEGTGRGRGVTPTTTADLSGTILPTNDYVVCMFVHACLHIGCFFNNNNNKMTSIVPKSLEPN